MNTDTVKDALRYYDSNRYRYESIRNKIYRYVRSSRVSDGGRSDNGDFFDKDGNHLFSSRIQLLGMHYHQMHMWVWGWGIPYFPSYLTTLIRKLFIYGSEMQVEDNISLTSLRSELITSRFRVDHPIQIDIHCAIATYLTKQTFIVFLDNVIETKNPNEVSNEKDYTMYLFILDPPKVED